MPAPEPKPLRTPFDTFAKMLLRELLDPVGTVELEAEVAATPRRVDLLFSRTEAGRLPPFFDSLFPEALNLIEFFHQAPGREELLSATLKQLLVRDTRDAEATLVLLCAGKPETLLKETQAAHRAGAMTGLYDLAPHHRTLIVVIAELPGTADTLLLRLTGAGKTLKRAIAEVKALHPRHPIRRQAERALVAVRLDPGYAASEAMKDMLHNYKELYQDWENKTREEGREEGGVKAAQEMLRTLLRVRFGEVDAEVDAALSAIRDLHRLQSLAALLVAAPFEQVRAAFIAG